MANLRPARALAHQWSQYGNHLLARKGNSSFTSTRAQNFSTNSFLRWVNVKRTSTIFRATDSRHGRASIAVNARSRAKQSAARARGQGRAGPGNSGIPRCSSVAPAFSVIARMRSSVSAAAVELEALSSAAESTSAQRSRSNESRSGQR